MELQPNLDNLEMQRFKMVHQNKQQDKDLSISNKFSNKGSNLLWLVILLRHSNPQQVILTTSKHHIIKVWKYIHMASKPMALVRKICSLALRDSMQILWKFNLVDHSDLLKAKGLILGLFSSLLVLTFPFLRGDLELVEMAKIIW
jgi:hypothetical protein